MRRRYVQFSACSALTYRQVVSQPCNADVHQPRLHGERGLTWDGAAAQVRGYVEDELNIVGNVPAQTGFQVLQGMRQLQGQAASFHLPIYAHHGSHDRCTSLPVSP